MQYPQEYKTAKSEEEGEKFDVAVLELEENIGDQYGSFGLDFSPKK